MAEHLHILKTLERIGQDIPLSLLVSVIAFCKYAVWLLYYKSRTSAFLIKTAEICGDIIELYATFVVCIGEYSFQQDRFVRIAYSGFRRSEMLGLEWKDIDFENNIITVKRTSNYTAERGIYTDTTKTKRSQRVLKISPYIMDILKEYKLEQDEEALRIGSKWVESDRLFVKWDGRPMNNNTPYFWLKEFCEENNFRFCDIHSLRHFYASALINEGVDAATVSGALGHSTITTTIPVPNSNTKTYAVHTDKNNHYNTETLKAENQMLWVQRMNAVRGVATEIVNYEMIY